MEKEISEAVRWFWRTKAEQSVAYVDPSGRGGVLGGRQLDGFLNLLVYACLEAGVPEECIFIRGN